MGKVSLVVLPQPLRTKRLPQDTHAREITSPGGGIDGIVHHVYRRRQQ